LNRQLAVKNISIDSNNVRIESVRLEKRIDTLMKDVEILWEKNLILKKESVAGYEKQCRLITKYTLEKEKIEEWKNSRSKKPLIIESEWLLTFLKSIYHTTCLVTDTSNDSSHSILANNINVSFENADGLINFVVIIYVYQFKVLIIFSYQKSLNFQKKSGIN
jgi:hypothetical protein